MNAIQIELSDRLAAEIIVYVNAEWFPCMRLWVKQTGTDLTEPR